MSTREATPPIVRWTLGLEDASALDGPVHALEGPVRTVFATGTRGEVLRGDWLGHALHPVLTDVVIGAYTFALIAAVFDVAGWSERSAAHGWWLALLVGLAFTVPAALTGLLEWLTISRGSELWKTATAHMLAMVTASVIFLVALLIGHNDWQAASIGAGPFALTVCGFVVLTVGGWLEPRGGMTSFVHTQLSVSTFSW